VRVFSLLVVASALGLAGCGSSTNATSTTVATPTTVAPATTTSTTIATVIANTTTSSPGASVSGIALIPEADRSPAGTAGKPPIVVVPAGNPPSHLEMADLIVGTGPEAETGDAVTVQYVLATYSTRNVIQSSWTSQPFPFTIGQGVIQGWSMGVVGMRAGGRRELIIPPSLGYGDQSPGAGIAANDTLVFVIDMLKIG
jgi:hypothetical protein